MGKAWIRKEVKQDRLQAAVDAAAGWVRMNPQRALGGALGAAAAVALAVFFTVRFFELRNEAWEQLAEVEKKVRSGAPEALGTLDDLVRRYAKAPAVPYAFLLKGDIMFFQGQYELAAQSYREALERGDLPAKAIARADLGLSLEAAGKHQDAKSELERFLQESPDHFLAPQAHVSLARCQEALEDKAQAKATYEKIALLYPETDWARTAERRAKILQ